MSVTYTPARLSKQLFRSNTFLSATISQEDFADLGGAEESQAPPPEQPQPKAIDVA